MKELDVIKCRYKNFEDRYEDKLIVYKSDEGFNVISLMYGCVVMANYFKNLEDLEKEINKCFLNEIIDNIQIKKPNQ